MSKPKSKHEFTDPDQVTGPIISVRFLVSLLVIAAGIAYVVIWTQYDRELWTFEHDLSAKPGDEPAPMFGFMKDLTHWNWLIGFGLVFLGLSLAAHPKTPLGRGRGVIVGMLGCFLIGLIWICVFYVFADKLASEPNSIWLLGSLGQLNLLVGIGFMAVGFTYATRWE